MENKIKNILHLKFNTISYITPEMLGNFVVLIKNKLGENWDIIVSPCEPSSYSEDYKLYNFDVDQLSKEEFLNIIQIENN